MDEMVYIIKNSGDIAYVFDSKEERQAKLTELLEEEKKYQYTHYYFDTEDITEGEYVCRYVCKSPEWFSEHLVKGKGNEKLGLNEQEYLNYTVALDCHKCPFKKHSDYYKADEERKAEQLRKDTAEYEEALKTIRELTIMVHCEKCTNKDCEHMCSYTHDISFEQPEYSRERLDEARKKIIELKRRLYRRGCRVCVDGCPHQAETGR